MDPFIKASSIQYFEEICKKILSNFFLKYGFELLESNESKITYYKDKIFMEIYYYPEDIPNYYLMISIGFAKKDKEYIEYDGVGLWCVLSQYDNYYKNWRFSNQEELEQTLTHICNNVLEKAAKPLWENPVKLRNLIDVQLNICESDIKKQVLYRRLLEAKQAFRNEQYKVAVRIFEECIDDLSTAELKMYNMSKKYLKKLNNIEP